MQGLHIDKRIITCNTISMSKKVVRKTTRKSSTPLRKVMAQETPGLSYDTKLIIVLLLLLFVYPLGLVFMWAWMKNWPVWLKLLIMLPLLLGLLIGIFFVIMIQTVVHEAQIERMQELQQMQKEKQMQQQKNGQFTLTPAPTSLPSTNNPEDY
jgi:hypothetical protein